MPEDSQIPIATTSGHKLSEELGALVEAFKDRPVSMKELVEISHNRGQLLLLIFFNIPFITPLPLPGISTPLGLVVAILGLRVGLAKKPWLPGWLMTWNLPPRFFSFILKASEKIFRTMESVLKPRWSYFISSFPKFLCGLAISISGALLMLPLPIPFTNGFPAWTVIMFAAGLIESDGAFVAAGWGLFILTIVYFVTLALLAVFATDLLISWMSFWKSAPTVD